MENKYCTLDLDLLKPKIAVKLEIKRLNKNHQLCYYDSADLTGLGISDNQLEAFTKLLSNAGFQTLIKKHTYSGIYDPSRMAELIELYPTDEELLQRELKNKSLWR